MPIQNRKRFWNWTEPRNEDGAPSGERVLFLSGAIAEESWFDDEVTPKLFKDELMSGNGDVTVWINSPGGDCVAAAQIYNMQVMKLVQLQYRIHLDEKMKKMRGR